MKTKKRWWPAEREKYWGILEDGRIHFFVRSALRDWWTRKDSGKYTGLYRTKREATAMRNKIKALVEKDLGK